MSQTTAKVSKYVERMEQRARDLGYEPLWVIGYGREVYGGADVVIYRTWFADSKRTIVAEGFSSRSLEEAYERGLTELEGVVGDRGGSTP